MTPGSAQRSTAVTLVSSPLRRRASHCARMPRISSPAALIAGVSVGPELPQADSSTQARAARRDDRRTSRKAEAIAFSFPPRCRGKCTRTGSALACLLAIGGEEFFLFQALFDVRLLQIPGDIDDDHARAAVAQQRRA